MTCLGHLESKKFFLNHNLSFHSFSGLGGFCLVVEFNRLGSAKCKHTGYIYIALNPIRGLLPTGLPRLALVELKGTARYADPLLVPAEA